MSGLLLQVLPLALGAAVSPMLLIVQLLTLSGRTQQVRRATAITLGAGVMLALITALLLTVGQNIDAGKSGSDPVGAVIRGVCADLLLFLGYRNVKKRGKESDGYGKRFANVKLRGYFVGGGVIMLADFTSLILYIPAMHIIVRSSAGSSAQAAAVAMIYVFTMLPLIVPLVIALAMGSKSDQILGSMNVFVTKHAAVINATICFAFAIYLAWGAYKSV